MTLPFNAAVHVAIKLWLHEPLRQVGACTLTWTGESARNDSACWGGRKTLPGSTPAGNRQISPWSLKVWLTEEVHEAAASDSARTAMSRRTVPVTELRWEWSMRRH